MKKDKERTQSHMSFRQGQLDYDPNASHWSFGWDKPMYKDNKT